MIPYRKISNKKIKSLIKFKLVNTLEEGIIKTVKWYKKKRNLIKIVFLNLYCF